MSRVDELPADQRAALSILLRQGKSYAEVAAMLSIPEQAVHDRAHAALAVLAPREARELDPAGREEIGEYLLGQQPGVGERLRTRTMLAGSPAANAWARALAGELAGLGGEPLPEVPPLAAEHGGEALEPYPLSQVAATAHAASVADPAPVAGAAAAPGAPASGSSSRRGGAILLGLIVVAGVVAVIVILAGGGSSHPRSPTRTSGTSTTAAGSPKAEATIQMRAPAGSPATGAVEILSEGSKRAFYILAEHLPETTGFFYAVWLYNSPSDALALSKAKPVTKGHRLAGAALLPSNAAHFREILLTRETSTRPTTPGPIVLRGRLNLKG
jgi:hypothetical protein